MFITSWARSKAIAVLLSAAFTACGVPAGAEAPPSETAYEFNIPSQNLNDALQALALASRHRLFYQADIVSGKVNAALNGKYTTEEAVRTILVGTDLRYEISSDGVVIVREKEDGPQAGVPRDERVRVAQAEGTTGGSAGGEQPAAPKGEEGARLEEIVVTGTHIRGSRSSASPVRVYTREDIDRAGFGSVKQLVESLPQNFANATENSSAAIAGGAGAAVDNRVGASGVNLRGLGPDSTLVLINGRRVSPGNYLGNFVDVSLIPLAAVERVEVVTDGASAIYGSDAVGGVVNFILRRNFSGAETRARVGSVSRGDRDEIQIGETLGHAWQKGSALLSYEYNKTTSLDSADRDYSELATDPFRLLPEQKRHGVFLTLNQVVTSGLELFLDGSYAQRDTSSDVSTPTSVQHLTADNESYSVAVGARMDLLPGASLELTATHAAGESRRKTFESGSALADIAGKPKIQSFDAVLTGSFWETAAGPLRYALGGQYRREAFDATDFLNETRFSPRRNVLAEFVEVRIPLLGAGDDTSSGPRLELSLADRNEHYSQFGTTNNPKLGFAWQAVPGVAVRGAWGKSFRAPTLNDLNGTPFFVVPVPMFDPVTSGTTNTLFVAGGNDRLNPEKAKSWTFGVDLRPQSLPGFDATLTYYDIRYDERIADPSASIGFFDFLINEAVLGPAIVQRDPSRSLVQQIADSAGAGYGDFFGLGLDSIGAIADARLHNLSSVRTNGVDFGISHRLDTGIGRLEMGVEGTRILKFENRFSPGSSSLDVLDAPYNPLDLRLRARMNLERDQVRAALFVNYTDSYENNRLTVPVRVASWTTVDLVMGYAFGQESGILHDLDLTLGATNLFDKDPPFLENPNFPINFDGANASPLGRFVYFQLLKRL